MHLNNATLYNLLSPLTYISNCAEKEAGYKLYLSKNHLKFAKTANVSQTRLSSVMSKTVLLSVYVIISNVLLVQDNKKVHHIFQRTVMKLLKDLYHFKSVIKT